MIRDNFPRLYNPLTEYYRPLRCVMNLQTDGSSTQTSPPGPPSCYLQNLVAVKPAELIKRFKLINTLFNGSKHCVKCGRDSLQRQTNLPITTTSTAPLSFKELFSLVSVLLPFFQQQAAVFSYHHKDTAACSIPIFMIIQQSLKEKATSVTQESTIRI